MDGQSLTFGTYWLACWGFFSSLSLSLSLSLSRVSKVLWRSKNSKINLGEEIDYHWMDNWHKRFALCFLIGRMTVFFFWYLGVNCIFYVLSQLFFYQSDICLCTVMSFYLIQTNRLINNCFMFHNQFSAFLSKIFSL